MSINLTSFRQSLSMAACRFSGNRNGSMITWVAVSLVPLMISAGLASDIARGFVLRSELAAALDAAALAGGRVFNADNRDEIIQQYFDANFTDGFLGAEVGELQIEAVSNPDEPDRLRVSASADMPTLFMRVAGFEKFDVGTAAEVTRENLGLQLTMVLDVTGSMSGSKIQALRNAASQLVDILFGENDESEKLEVAIVPYSQAVNVGDLGDAFIDRSNLPPELFSSGNDDRRWGGCVQARSTPGILSDDASVLEADAYDANLAPVGVGGKWKPYIYPHWNNRAPYYDNNRWRQFPFPDESWDPTDPGFKAPVDASGNYFLPGVPEERQDFPGIGGSYRNGDGPIWNRDPSDPDNWQQYNLPSGNRGPNRNCPEQLLEFTNIKSTLNDYINANLTTGGWTIGNQGLVWGWRILDPDAPFANDVPYNDPQTIKALIMMTDGLNQIGWRAYTAYGRLNPAESNHLGVNTPGDAVEEFDKRIKKICYAMKEGGQSGRDKIVIYTVIFGNIATSSSQQAENLRDIYRNCASKPANAFLAPSNSELESAFQTIGNDLANLHLSR